MKNGTHCSQNILFDPADGNDNADEMTVERLFVFEPAAPVRVLGYLI